MKHDYKAALQSVIPIKLNYSGRQNAWMLVKSKKNAETIRHALAMMQKLQEPSEGMLETMKQIIWNNTWSKDNCRFHIARLLEQAEKEIEHG